MIAMNMERLEQAKQIFKDVLLGAQATAPVWTEHPEGYTCTVSWPRHGQPDGLGCITASCSLWPQHLAVEKWQDWVRQFAVMLVIVLDNQKQQILLHALHKLGMTVEQWDGFRKESEGAVTRHLLQLSDAEEAKEEAEQAGAA